MTTTAIQSWECHLPKSVSLYFVDYRDSLDEHEELKNSLYPLDEEAFEWYSEQLSENIRTEMQEIKKTMEKAGLGCTYDEHEDEIRDKLYERNDTDPAEGLIKLLEVKGYRKVTLETDKGDPQTFYSYCRGLHINASGDLSFHIVPKSQSLGLGRFAICATKDGKSSQLGTDWPELFFPRLLSFLQGETSEGEIIRDVAQ